MEKLSLTIITFNEEGNIRDALESVKWADEIIIIDSGSTDKTVEICKEYTGKVYDNPWPGFVAQKNYAINKANNRWILSIDADERVTPELMEEISAILKAPKADAYAVPRKVYYLGRWINYSGWYPDYKERLFNKEKCRWEGKEVHEKLKVNGKIAFLKGDLHHYTFGNVDDHLKTVSKYTSLAADEYAKEGKKAGLLQIIIRPSFMFFKSYVLKQGFRDGLPGFIIAVISSFHVFIKYVKLWELVKKDYRSN